jgi:hypothetical protein
MGTSIVSLLHIFCTFRDHELVPVEPSLQIDWNLKTIGSSDHHEAKASVGPVCVKVSEIFETSLPFSWVSVAP